MRTDPLPEPDVFDEDAPVENTGTVPFPTDPPPEG